jgi:hypothetical protein
MKKLLFLLTTITILQTIVFAQGGDPKLTEVWKPVPPVVTPGATSADAPSDAIVLFNGKGLDAWESAKGGAASWTLKEGAMTVKPGTGGIRTKDSLGSCQLHIEWQTPALVKGEGQGRGNSGIFLMGLYELQVLDSYDNVTYSNGQAGSMYKQSMPLVNVCRKPGEWQSYDIIFTAPVFWEDGRLKEPARITVLHNGVLIQHNVAIWGQTSYIGIPKYEKHAGKLPLVLQDHGDLVSYRNIWLRNL